MKALSVFLYVVSFGIVIWVLICSFSTWIAFWGAGGAVFNVFLFPLAILGYPIVQWTLTDQVSVFWGYLDIVLAIVIFLLGRYVRERSYQV